MILFPFQNKMWLHRSRAFSIRFRITESMEATVAP
jgi:hypothetical protein